MYFLPTINSNELGDFDVLEYQGRLHLFYLELPSHDAVGHLVSEDGLNWKRLLTALRTGDPGEFDDDQIWTMGVFIRDHKWFMLYTANQQQGMVQVIGLATSPDGMVWTKVDHNPVVKPDARWYEAQQHGNLRIDWRDPHVIEHNGKFHAFVCARENHGTINRRGCAGYFTSDDGYHWQVQPPPATPRNAYDYECPSVFEMNNRFYMVAIHGGHNRATYRVADQIDGPYRRPFDDSLTPGNNLSLRPCVWRGKTYLFHWNRGHRDWPSRHANFAVLASPKLVNAHDDGSITLESFDWCEHHAGPTCVVNAQTSVGHTIGDWAWQGDVLHADASPGTGLWLTAEPWQDFEINATVQLDPQNPAREFGLAIRTDNDGDCGIFAACVPGRSTCELVKMIHNPLHGPGSYWRGRSVIQSFHMTPQSHDTYHLRLIAYGPNIEFNVNHRLALADLTLPRRAGRVGLLVEDGCAMLRDIAITPLREPQTNWLT